MNSHRVGTIFGRYTIAELNDLLRAKDYELQLVSTSSTAFLPLWSQHDAAAAEAWQSDFQTLEMAYVSARATAQEAIADSVSSLLPQNLNPANDAYMGVIKALRPDEPNVIKGDFQDLYDRLSAAQVALDYPVISEPGVPQPGAGTDADLNAYLAADKALKTADKGFVGLLALAGAAALFFLFRKR